MRFTDALGGLNGDTADRMIFYSINDGGAPTLADTGIPANVDLFVGYGVYEENGVFQFGDPNVFIGVSDVPEPASAGLMIVGIFGLGVVARRRIAR